MDPLTAKKSVVGGSSSTAFERTPFETVNYESLWDGVGAGEEKDFRDKLRSVDAPWGVVLDVKGCD